MSIYERWSAKLAIRRKLLTAATQRLAAARKKKLHPRQALVDLEQLRERQVSDALAVLKRHPKPLGPRASALKFAKAQIGVKEQPAGSNSGPKIDDWQKEAGMGHGPWCGAFVGAVLRHVGVKVTDRITYVPYILEDAKTGRNGFVKIVPWGERQAGDIFVYQWDTGPVDHTGIYTGSDQDGLALVIEGNTGNDSNGGEVMQRARDRKFVAAVCRPRWP